MVTNMRMFILSILLFTALFPLGAQTAVQETGGPVGYFYENRFVQRLKWTGDGYALRYEVLIEKAAEKNSGFIRVLQEYTEDFYVDISLAPGKYRYQVISYDLFNRPGNKSEWILFEVRSALRPEIDSFSPELFYADENNTELTITVNGKNITADAEIFIRNLDSGKVSINPVKQDVAPDGRRAVLLFDTAKLIPGLYVIVIRNSGGMEAVKGELIVNNYKNQEPSKIQLDIAEDTPQRALAFYSGFAWTPLLPISGGIEQMYGRELQLIGAGLRFGAAYNKPEVIRPGMELMTSLYIQGRDFVNYSTETFTMAVNLNLFLQIWPASSFAVVVRGGAGYALQTSNYDGNEQEDLYLTGGKAPYARAGVSLLWSPSKYFFIEAGADYSVLLVMQNPSAYLNPCVSIGWRY